MLFGTMLCLTLTTPSGDQSGGPDEASIESVSEQLIEGISSHAIFMLDDKGRIESWPASATALYGFEAAAVVGDTVGVLFADGKDQLPDLDDLLSRAKTGTQEVEHWNERADGSVFWATLTFSPLWNDAFHGYAVISQDTTAKKQYEQMLERQNDRLKEFTDILAHDLQSPLSLIDGRLELYRETGDKEHIEQIDATTDRMQRLVDDLLRVARQGNVVTNPEATDLKRVIETAWEGTGATAGQAGLEYQTIHSVAADGDRLCELFENLFRNAIEHGGKRVQVQVGPLDDGFYIEDDGTGIEPELQDDVFEHGFTTTEAGSGYGLSVVRTIVNAHGWDIRIRDGDSGGARFEITGVEFLD